MAVFTAKDPSDFSRDHYSWYEGEYTGHSFEEGKFGPQIKWTVQFDGEDRETWVFTGTKLTPRTKFGKLVKGWGGVDPQPGVEFDTEDIEPGIRVKLMYGPQEKDPEKTTEIQFEQA